MLRHTIATLAYRAGKALRGAPDGFGEYRPAPGARSAGEILSHMGDLCDWALSIAQGQQRWSEAPPQPWNENVQRFFDALARLDAQVAAAPPAEQLALQLFQGPVADALQHTGQIAMLRRLAGAPITGENYFVAAIVEGRVTLEQAPPRKEF
jgi:hypothetical protein